MCSFFVVTRFLDKYNKLFSNTTIYNILLLNFYYLLIKFNIKKLNLRLDLNYYFIYSFKQLLLNKLGAIRQGILQLFIFLFLLFYCFIINF